MAGFNPDVVWSVDTYGLSLIHQKTGAKLSLGYPEAALWDLLSREVDLTWMIRIMAAIAGIAEPAALSLIFATIEGWVAAGWLLKE
jgi:hypothetical protein